MSVYVWLLWASPTVHSEFLNIEKEYIKQFYFAFNSFEAEVQVRVSDQNLSAVCRH